MHSPDFIADQAILTISAWQRETSQQRANRLLYRDQARRWAQQDNKSEQDWQRVNDVVRGCMEGEHDARL
jgi:hypothetical protein